MIDDHQISSKSGLVPLEYSTYCSENAAKFVLKWSAGA